MRSPCQPADSVLCSPVRTEGIQSVAECSVILSEEQIRQQLQHHIFRLGICIYHALFLSIELAYHRPFREREGLAALYHHAHGTISLAVDESAELRTEALTSRQRAFIFIKALPAVLLRKLVK